MRRGNGERRGHEHLLGACYMLSLPCPCSIKSLQQSGKVDRTTLISQTADLSSEWLRNFPGSSAAKPEPQMVVALPDHLPDGLVQTKKLLAPLDFSPSSCTPPILVLTLSCQQPPAEPQCVRLAMGQGWCGVGVGQFDAEARGPAGAEVAQLGSRWERSRSKGCG